MSGPDGSGGGGPEHGAPNESNQSPVEPTTTTSTQEQQFTPDEQKAILAAKWMIYLQGVADSDEREILKLGLPLLISANEQPPQGKPKITDEQRVQARADRERQMRPESEASKRNKDLQELLSQKSVQDELKKDTPNFNSDALKGLMNHFDQIDISSEQGGELYMAAQSIAGLSTQIHRTDGMEVSEASRRVLFEMAYEKLIGKPDYGSEDAQYKIGGFQMQALMDEVDALSIREFNQRLPGENNNFANYLSTLQYVREVAHELNRNLSYGEKYKEYVLSSLRGEGLDFMQNKMAGVGTVVRMYEKAAAARVSETHKQFVEGDIKNIDEEVQKAIEGLSTRGTLTKEGRALTDWESKRALRIGKVLFSGTQRMAMYTGIGDINESLPASSLHSEYIVRALMPFKETSPRFFSSNPGSARLMELVFKEAREASARKGSAYVSLFGAREDSMLQSACGAKDAESHSWRSQMMFLGNLNMGDQQTLLDYLTAQQGAMPAEKPDGTKWKHTERTEAFSTKVKSDVLGQRLYLSVLARHGDFDSSLKKEIWEKIALLKPSTLASLLPETLGEGNGDVWNSLRRKLYIAEEERVEHDAREHDALAGDTEGLRLLRKTEKEGFENVRAMIKSGGSWTPDQWTKILKYMGMESLTQGVAGQEGSLKMTPVEEKLLRHLIKNGVDSAGKLSTAQFPFTFVIDDAPKIAWKKTGNGQAGLDPADLIRILVSDQQSYTEGWNELNGLFEFPTKDVIKHFSIAVDKIGIVDGRSNAQNQLEPFIAGWLKMAQTKTKDLWIPGAMTVKQMLRKPTSIMEEYYRSEFVSLDENEKGELLAALAHAKAIRDSLDPDDMLENMTQLDRMRKKTKSDRMSLLIANLRIMILIFGPAFGMEFMNAIMPKELQE